MKSHYDLAMELWGKNVRIPQGFIRSPHPKTSVEPSRTSIDMFLSRGWWAQHKIDGHSAQMHMGEKGLIAAYTRQGTLHTKKVSTEIAEALHALFPSLEGESVIMGEWVKPQNRLFLFDVLKVDGKRLTSQDYATRHEYLPPFTGNKHVVTLPVFKTEAAAMRALSEAFETEHIEGLVFRKADLKGIEDMGIVRCRKSGVVIR